MQQPTEIPDPDTYLSDLNLFPPCSKGCAIIYSPSKGTIDYVPLTCKSWACPDCSKYLATKLHTRIAAAQPDKFITLTVRQDPDLTPEIAEYIIRKQWPKFIERLRKRGMPFEYLRVIEYQQNGWPHVHLLARSHYIPHETLHRLWQRHVIAGFVSIKAVKRPDSVGAELTKYIRKSFLINARRNNRRKAYTVSKKFFRPEAEPTEEKPPADQLVFMTTQPWNEVHAFIYHTLGVHGLIEAKDSRVQLLIKEVYRDSAVTAILPFLGSLDWWKKGYNTKVASAYDPT